MRGKFITFEGGEGTGKSTQAAMLALRLETVGIGVKLTREPGGSPGAEIIRHVLLSGAAKPLGPEAEAMLFAAARDDHIQCTILPALECRQMGHFRPLHRFHTRLSGRARRRRSALHQGAGAGFGRRSPSRSDVRARCAGRSRARACRRPAPWREPPIASRRSKSNSMRSCAALTSRLPPRSRNAASSSTRQRQRRWSPSTSGRP